MSSQALLIVVALEMEAKPMVQELQLLPTTLPVDPDLGLRCFSNQPSEQPIVLMVSGQCKKFGVDRIGTQAATLMAWESIKATNPRLIINAGTAGGFRAKNCNIADVYLSEACKYHDRLLPSSTSYTNYGIGSCDCHDLAKLAKKLDIKLGTISTGNSLFASAAEYKQMHLNNADAKDMEAAAIAEAAFIKQVPFVALKVITDT